MKNKIISLLLALSLLLSLTACGQYNPSDSDGKQENEQTSDTDSGGTSEDKGEPFVATVMLGGKAYTPPKASDDSLALKVRWTDGVNYHTVTVGEDGRAECYGLDGDYTVTLVNLSSDYTYNPNIYKASNDSRSVIIELLTLTKTRGTGTGLYSCIALSKPGNYRAQIKKEGQIVYYEFTPTRAGIYSIESMVDVIAGMYDPVADVYNGSMADKKYAYQLDGGGASGSYTTNFKHTISIDEKFIGNCYTFGVFVNIKDATYPVNVDFSITYEGSYEFEWTVSNLMYPAFIPNDSTYDSWYEDYVAYLKADRLKYGDLRENIASVTVDGKNVFDAQYFRLNEEDGYYHVYDEEKYAAYGGWGPILYANISTPCIFLDTALNMVEYAGNKALTVSSGTENYKLFIEGYNELIKSHGDVGPYFCVDTCACYATNGGACATEDNCQTCFANGCRTLPRRYIGQRGYADIAIDGRCPVTEELKDFLQKFASSQKYFSDGNGWIDGDDPTRTVPRYHAYEDSQWLFACMYYT